MTELTNEDWQKQTEFPKLGRKLRILAFVPNDGGCSYYRLIMPYRKLVEKFSNVVDIKFDYNPLGWELPKDGKPFSENINRELFDWADIVVTNNITNYGVNYLARVCGITKEHKKKFHFDTDDLLTDIYAGHRLERTYKEGGLSEVVKWVYHNSDLTTVTQRKFAERISQYCQRDHLLAVIKNSIDYDLPAWSSPRTQVHKGRFVRIGWAGGIHHEEDVKEFAGVPWIVNQKVGIHNVRWDFYGKPPIQDDKDQWQHDVWKNYERIICNGFKGAKNYTINAALPADRYGVMYANMDAAIAPLQMNPFNDSKSDIKVAEAGRYKVPLICSNVGCYDDTIVNGKTGFLIPPSAPAKIWVDTLAKCIKNPDLLREMGENLHKITEEKFNINKVLYHRLNLYSYLLNSNEPKI
jgi:glycosyltransferase involved in cell wall biosynthesis